MATVKTQEAHTGHSEHLLCLLRAQREGTKVHSGAVTHTGGDSWPCSCERLLRKARRCDVMWHCCQLQSSGGGETTVRNASNRMASEPTAQRSKRPPP